MAASTAGELLKMSGLRNPYPEGDPGVVKEGAYADLLLVDGNPLQDLSAVTDSGNRCGPKLPPPDDWLAFVLLDGAVENGHLLPELPAGLA